MPISSAFYSSAIFAEMRALAYRVPLVEARGAALPYFRQLDREAAVGLTLNK